MESFVRASLTSLGLASPEPPSPPPVTKPPDHDEVENRKSSFSHFDLDQRTPVPVSSISPRNMFDELKTDTPAGQALKEVRDLKIGRMEKVSNKIIKKRPKLKNLTKDVKKSRRRRRSHIKGKKIDGKHEQYALSIGMMLGIRVCVGRVDQGDQKEKKKGLKLEDFMQVEKLVFPPGGNTVGPYITPPHQLAHTFKFKAYAPKIFSKIRQMFGGLWDGGMGGWGDGGYKAERAVSMFWCH